ncbi:hypothetical protein MOQ72_38745 [Saccharopolyspora sp. K220]|uniref:hypothetical protein n=1 Tax=Saccharopolyspora soli TaxID=2926618 RepID=UPI001F562903|nr:hypothetical protein [Saccharopolyspora soli]MCI2423374.1 hypothetical protein [Saccharopolyspora soli]
MGLEWRAKRDQLVRAVLLSLAAVLMVSACSLYLVELGLLHPVWVAPIGETTGLVLGFGFLLRNPMAKARFAWGSLSTGDWISVVFFPVSLAMGWGDFWRELRGHAHLIAVGLSTVGACGFFIALMLFGMKMARAIRSAVRVPGQPVTVDVLRYQRRHVWHRVHCDVNVDADRYKRQVSAAARRRRKDRNSRRVQAFYRCVDALIRPYENSTSWMSAALASGGLFIWLVQNVKPGPLGVLILASPLLTIPIIETVRSRLSR